MTKPSVLKSDLETVLFGGTSELLYTAQSGTCRQNLELENATQSSLFSIGFVLTFGMHVVYEPSSQGFCPHTSVQHGGVPRGGH